MQLQANVASATSLPQASAVSIAVLPFTNLSGDTAQEFFSDGMTEEITAALAKIPSLRVVARTSAFAFKGNNQDMRAIGQALGASHLIEGSVRKAGDRVRITAQLIEADDGTHLWAENYDSQLTDIFATQEDIAQAIAGALRVPLGLQQGETLVRSRTRDLESYDQYLRARALVRARAIGGAIAVLEPAVARDPEYAPARGLLAQAYVLAPAYSLLVRSGSVEEARRLVQSSFDKAEMAAREAIRLDARHAGGYTALAAIQLNRRNWAASEDLYRQSLALDPNDADNLLSYSLFLGTVGHFKQALSVTEQLRTLEPFVPIYNIVAAYFLQLDGQNEAAMPILEAVPPGGLFGYYRNLALATAYTSAGRYSEAADTLLSMPQQSPVSRRSIEDAARLLRAPTKVSAPDALPAFEGELGFVYAVIGAPNRVFDFAERSVDIGAVTGTGVSFLWNPSYAPLRKTERFKALMRKAGLVDYWHARGWPDLCRPLGVDDFVCD